MSCTVTTATKATTKITTTHIEQVNDHLPDSNTKPTMFQRLADWLWPQVYDDVDYYYYIETQPQTTSTTATNESSPLHQATHSSSCRDASKSSTQADIACRSCRVQGLDCDRRLPHCSQCRDQQVVCFFVAPLPRLTKTTPAKSTAKDKATKTTVPSSQAVQC